MLQPPCKNCKYRNITCHDRCSDFQEYRTKVDKANDNRRQRGIIIGYSLEACKRMGVGREL